MLVLVRNLHVMLVVLVNDHRNLRVMVVMTVVVVMMLVMLDRSCSCGHRRSRCECRCERNNTEFNDLIHCRLQNV